MRRELLAIALLTVFLIPFTSVWTLAFFGRPSPFGLKIAGYGLEHEAVGFGVLLAALIPPYSVASLFAIGVGGFLIFSELQRAFIDVVFNPVGAFISFTLGFTYCFLVLRLLRGGGGE
ncbi:MAG: hypothetical protein FGF50_08640 [Candidatus Brockarchaeota archaeon]|nr:hypothetical protein [Candidatus Brockarchaeota archaeon]